MQYYGGKHRIAKDVAGVLNSLRKPDQLYLEPFVGGCNVAPLMDGPMLLSDYNAYVVALWEKCVKEGMDWLPDSWSEEQFYAVRADYQAFEPGLVAFSEIGCGFGGKWRTGYARCAKKRSYAPVAKRSIAKKIAKLQGKRVGFMSCPYDQHQPEDCLIHSDPPYANTELGYSKNKFDSAKFWETMDAWSENNTVVVSELTAPPGWTCAWEKTGGSGPCNVPGTVRVITQKTERLFMKTGVTISGIEGPREVRT